MKRVGLLLAIVIGLLLMPTALAEEKEISIGVLVDLSGPLATYGNDIKNTLEIAKEDINAYFKEKGLPYKVEFYYEDTRVDPKVALDKVQALYGRGIKLIIGPMGSGEVKNIKDFVTSNKIIIVSPSSTALPSIIGFTKPEEKKYIFRFVGIDDLQSQAIAGELKDLGIKGVVITYIGNAWGKGLYECIKPQLEEAGIEVAKVVEYPDQTPADFTPYITELENGVKDLITKYGNDKVAVIAFSYEEVYTMIAQTKADSPLFKVIWFGCDGCAKSGRIDEVCDKVTKIGVYSTLFESKGPAYESLKAKYQEKGFGESPYQYALNAYDAAWVLALAYVEVMDKNNGEYDPDLMAETIPVVTEKYSKGEYGVKPVSGYIKLNEWNDRASGDYAIWYVNKDCKWDAAGVWKFETKSIEWYHKPTPPVVETTAPAETTPAETTPVKTEKKTPGFEIALAVVSLLAVAYALRRH
jgi:branched-chain amino acid transport system substrate-binding protein